MPECTESTEQQYIAQRLAIAELQDHGANPCNPLPKLNTLQQQGRGGLYPFYTVDTVRHAHCVQYSNYAQYEQYVKYLPDLYFFLNIYIRFDIVGK